MIRRSLFSQTGLFPTDRGSIGDFQWVMKATLITDTIYLPDTWGGWRQHGRQATAFLESRSPGHWQALEVMSRCALKEAESFLSGTARIFIESASAMSSLKRNRIRSEFGAKAGLPNRIRFLVDQSRTDPCILTELIIAKFKSVIGLRSEYDAADWIRFLKDHGIEPTLIPV
jgi:hypothetical protein